ncbi:MAG: Adenosylcobinamide-phosphate guanylyltransferase [Clostridiales bacterium 38_11]|nr:MAG: Adenosylcobinamide-phosphate guanylyltransferase [Clostridiales bacterium 38_11]HBH11680.1 bifunctional adenosylcobinamide kinase/adenosylcobinamide-phosphate guanylyltransferase [Clostridiales bacterium]
MTELIMVTGGARSGKSTIAEKIFENNETLLYIATSIPFDEEMKDRIMKHRDRRDEKWRTVEMYQNFIQLKENRDFIACQGILLDCITVMLSNWFYYKEISETTSLEQYEELEHAIIEDISNLINLTISYGKKMVIVTNELGMGIVPGDRMTRMYRDIAGRINQFIAKKADKVILSVSGIGIDLKKNQEG